MQGVVWTKWHYVFAIICPVPMVLLVLLAAKGWHGFAIMVGVVPLVAILIAIGLSHHYLHCSFMLRCSKYDSSLVHIVVLQCLIV